MRRIVSAALLSIVGAAGAACGDDGPPPVDAGRPGQAIGPLMTTSTVAPNGRVVIVQALDNSFRPELLTIEAGTEVVFTNVGRNHHDVLAVTGPEWGVHEDGFAPGDEYSYVFAVPGHYAYYCSIHGTTTVGMVGTIVVTG